MRFLTFLADYYLSKTRPLEFARKLGVRFGENCRFIDVSKKTFGSEPYLIKIGRHVTISSGIRFITHDGGVWVFREMEPEIDLIEPINIGDNVFLGINVIILAGVSIGNNVVVGAGSIVTKDIPDNLVVAGIPARVVSSIEQYRNKISPRLDQLKGMSASRKAEYLRQKYGIL